MLLVVLMAATPPATLLLLSPAAAGWVWLQSCVSKLIEVNNILVFVTSSKLLMMQKSTSVPARATSIGSDAFASFAALFNKRRTH
jgi:hypothetical protein